MTELKMGDTLCEGCSQPVPWKDTQCVRSRVDLLNGKPPRILHFHYHEDCLPEEVRVD